MCINPVTHAVAMVTMVTMVALIVVDHDAFKCGIHLYINLQLLVELKDS